MIYVEMNVEFRFYLYSVFKYIGVQVFGGVFNFQEEIVDFFEINNLVKYIYIVLNQLCYLCIV